MGEKHVTTGDRFRLFRKNTRWYWELQGGHFPTGPIAQCREEGYRTREQAKDSMRSAHRAMEGAIEDDGTYWGTIRIQEKQVLPPDK